jgi:hypothetical protein
MDLSSLSLFADESGFFAVAALPFGGRGLTPSFPAEAALSFVVVGVLAIREAFLVG